MLFDALNLPWDQFCSEEQKTQLEFFFFFNEKKWLVCINVRLYMHLAISLKITWSAHSVDSLYMIDFR